MGIGGRMDGGRGGEEIRMAEVVGCVGFNVGSDYDREGGIEI